MEIKSEVVNDVLESLASENTKINYKVTLNQLHEFVNSKEGLSKEISIDDLVAEAKSDVRKTQERIDLFYKWLQGQKLEGYALRVDDKGKLKTMRASSAYQKAYGYLKGFFVNIDISFEKKWEKHLPKPERKQALKKDKIYSFYDIDEETKTITFKREQLQQFLSNLKLRDEAITLALLSSSQDAGDLFKLNVSDIREQTNSRIFWEGYRGKSKVLFRTFISKEATKVIRRYLDQERQGAKDDEPLFLTSEYKGENHRMNAKHLASVFRDAARKMGIKWGYGDHNPLRPKRMRHLFRTACDVTGVPELYTNAFMGHVNSQGQDYSEIPKPLLELEYLKVEPFITVYGEVKEALEIKEDVQKLEHRILDLNKEIEGLKNQWKKLEEFTMQWTSMTPQELEVLAELAREKLRQQVKEEDREKEKRLEDADMVSKAKVEQKKD